MDSVLIMEIQIVFTIQEDFRLACIVSQVIVFSEEVAINAVDVIFVQPSSYVLRPVKADIHHLTMHAYLIIKRCNSTLFF